MGIYSVEMYIDLINRSYQYLNIPTRLYIKEWIASGPNSGLVISIFDDEGYYEWRKEEFRDLNEAVLWLKGFLNALEKLRHDAGDRRF